MPANLRKFVRARMEKTGESYQTALRHVRAAAQRVPLAPSDAPAPPLSPPPDGEVRYFSVDCDYETSLRAGAGGTFQVAALIEGDHDVTHLVDQGYHFHDLKELEEVLRRITRGDVVVDEV